MYTSMYSTAGKRSDNQDTIWPESPSESECLFILADGMGGLADGKEASRLACQTVREMVEREDPAHYVFGGSLMSRHELMQSFLYDVARTAGAAVWQAAHTRGVDMGSTLLVVLLDQGQAYVAHVGDCALFLARDGRLPPEKVTAEHRRGAALIRSLGAQEHVTPDIFQFPFGPRDVLLLGCDGFWEHVSADKIGKILTERPPMLTAKALAEAALGAGSDDNVSVVVLEGDSFGMPYCERRIVESARAFAGTEGSDALTDQEELLGFACLHADRTPNIARAIADILRRHPQGRELWTSLGPRLSPTARNRIAVLFGGDGGVTSSGAEPFPRLAQAPDSQGVQPAPGEVIATKARPPCSDPYLISFLDLLDRGHIDSAFAKLEIYLAYGNPRATAEALLGQYVEYMLDRPWHASDPILYTRFLEFASPEPDVRFAVAKRVWESSDVELAWRLLRPLYDLDVPSAAAVIEFMQEATPHPTASLLRTVIELSRSSGRPGATWAITEMARSSPDQTQDLRRFLGQVAERHALAGERAAASNALQNAPFGARAPTAGSASEAQAFGDRYEVQLADLREQLMSAKRELEKLRAERLQEQERFEGERKNFNSLGRAFLALVKNVRPHAEQIFNRDTLQQWEQWLAGQGITYIPPEQPAKSEPARGAHAKK